MKTDASCPHCDKKILISYVGGMSNNISLRCEKCGTCTSVSPYDEHFDQLRRFEGSDSAAIEALSKNLNPCSCGGTFRSQAPPRCPHCSVVLSDKELRKLARLPTSSIQFTPYFIVGNSIQAKWVKGYGL